MVPHCKLQENIEIIFTFLYPLGLILKRSINLKTFYILLCNYYNFVFNKLNTSDKNGIIQIVFYCYK